MAEAGRPSAVAGGTAGARKVGGDEGRRGRVWDLVNWFVFFFFFFFLGKRSTTR